MKDKPQIEHTTMDNSNTNLKIKGNKLGTFKSPPPRRLNLMLRAINFQENCQDINDKEDSLSYNEPDLCNDYISKEQDNADRCFVNFPRHCVLGHVLLDTDPLDEVDSWKKVVRPSKKPRSVDPRR